MRRLLLALLATLCVSGTSRATSYFWGTPRPQGNPIHSIAMLGGQTGVAVGEKGTVLRTTDAGTTWTDISNLDAFTTDLFGVRALPGGDLLAVGGLPGIFRSTDAGATWEPVANPATAPLRHLDLTGGSTWSAVGENGLVVRSTDSGATWGLLPSPGNTRLVDQFWFDPQNGYVLGVDLVRRTTNGGQSWVVVPDVQENFFLPGDIKFLDPQNGWIMVDFATWRTTNGGVSWFQKNPPFGQGPGYQEEGAFLDANTRWVCTSGEGAEIWKTTDDGIHWIEQLRQDTVGGCTDLVRLPGGRLLAVGTGGDLLHSDDDGTTWIDYTSSPSGLQRFRMEAVLSLDDGRCFAGGDGSAWMTSADFGHSWVAPPASPALATIYSIAFRGQLGLVAGFAGGGQSRMARTTDGGVSWSLSSLSPNYAGDGQSVSMPADQIAFVATYGGTGNNSVFRSTDSGATWQQRNNGLSTSIRFNSIFFLDANVGFLGVGDFGNAAVYKTTDGGDHWAALGTTGLGDNGIIDMHWFDVTRGIVGTIGDVRLTTNGGNSWATVCSGAFGRVSFRDSQHGFASSLGPEYFETTDGGLHWSTVPFPFSNTYYDIEATPTGFLVAGEVSTIMGAAEANAAVPVNPIGGPVHAMGISGDRRGTFPLQAAPNPATDRVELRFRNPSAGTARVELLDVRGRRIVAWSAPVPEGDAVLRWNRAGVASGSEAGRSAGIYLARVIRPDGRTGMCRLVFVRGG